MIFNSKIEIAGVGKKKNIVRKSTNFRTKKTDLKRKPETCLNISQQTSIRSPLSPANIRIEPVQGRWCGCFLGEKEKASKTGRHTVDGSEIPNHPPGMVLKTTVK